MTIPVTVLIVTKNEEQRLAACLHAVQDFAHVIVIDLESRDRTKQIAADHGARVIEFIWNGQYPKKRQWVLETVPISTEWILWVDADEIITPALKAEIAALFESGPACAGYFIKGRYRLQGRVLRFGVQNSKLVLFKRGAFSFPVVDDLDIPGMGEIEGHYQPVPTDPAARIGVLKEAMIYGAYDDPRAWIFRHEKYARWEVGMNAKDAWPADPVPWRQRVKVGLRQTRFRPEVMFLISYVMKLGLLDGRLAIFLRKAATSIIKQSEGWSRRYRHR